MAQREYTTASGKKIDFDTMQLKGEETIAVGNMGVNARGDRLGTGGDVIQTREEVMADYYRIHNGTIPEDKPIGGNDDDPVDDLITADAVPPTIEADTDIDEDNISSEKLAQALAETADEVKQEPALQSAAAEVLAPEIPAPIYAPEQAPQVIAKQVELSSKMSVPTPTEVDTNQEAQDEIASSTGKAVEEESPRGGLASAVAKVKTSKPVIKEKTKQQEIKEKGGVKRL
tara:strand:+ start:804 stop:1493 length:690 start_codon:yes stop_codon:yes gene_type:complete